MGNDFGGATRLDPGARSSAPDIGELTAPDTSFTLTPDALVSYLSIKLQGLDAQIGQRLNAQSLANAKQKVLNTLLNTLQAHATGSKDPAKLAEVTAAYEKAIQDAGPGELASQLEQQLADFKGTASDNDVEEGEMGGFINAARSMNDTVKEGSEIMMTELQSLVSSRQQAVQMVTNMLNTYNEGLKGIASNVGR